MTDAVDPCALRRARRTHPRHWLTAVAAAASLTACGGGGGGGENKATPDPVTPAPLTLTGVVARGAAQANATVQVKCATGSGTATSGADGSYSASIAGGVLPCALQAQTAGGALTSVATTSKANITPFTELLVAQLTAQMPANWYGSVAASALGTAITTASVSAAQAQVSNTLTSAGVDLTGVGDFVSGALVAAVGSTTGNIYDKALDALQAKLVSSGTTLTQLTQAVAQAAAGAGTGPLTVPVDDSSEGALPANLLLLPKAANCDSLRSTRYKGLQFGAAGPDAPGVAVDVIDVNAATLVNSSPDGLYSFAFTPNGGCRYTDATSDVVVHPSGVIVGRSYIGTDDVFFAPSARGTIRMLLAIPEQKATLADIAGEWNYMNWQPASGVWTVEAGSFTLNSSGTVTAYSCNTAIAAGTPTCLANAPTGAFNADSTLIGGFTFGGPTDRYWSFRDGHGHQFLVGLSDDGQPFFATRKRSDVLPAVGKTWNARFFGVDPNNQAPDAMGSSSFTVASVDAAAGTFVRNATVTGSTVAVPHTFQINSGGMGYRQRPAASVKASDGSTVAVRPQFALPLIPGMTVYWLPNTASAGNNSRLGVSVKAP